MMLTRRLEHLLQQRLRQAPAVVLLGPRQVGKTSLAREVAARHPGALVLDLERASDRAALERPELFFAAHRDRLLVLDEVQHLPRLFEALRPEIDADRRPGRFLLLGSASGDLLRQSGESLAGRVSYLELTPFLAAELMPDLAGLQSLWLRGGFPLSWLAPDDEASFSWRQDFIRTFLQRDLPGLGLRIPADTLMVRRLPPHLPNLGKRLVKSPKVYLRDSGLLHALLGLATVRELQGHPVAGASWEGFVVEQVAAQLPADAQLSFYRTAVGAEIDLIVEHRGRTLAVEIKFSSAPKPARGFWQALQDLGIERAFVVAPVTHRYPLAEGVEVLPLQELGTLCA